MLACSGRWSLIWLKSWTCLWVSNFFSEVVGQPMDAESRTSIISNGTRIDENQTTNRTGLALYSACFLLIYKPKMVVEQAVSSRISTWVDLCVVSRNEEKTCGKFQPDLTITDESYHSFIIYFSSSLLFSISTPRSFLFSREHCNMWYESSFHRFDKYGDFGVEYFF